MTSPQPMLALENVSKNFGGLRVVDDLSFCVPRGTCTALIGLFAVSIFRSRSRRKR